MVDVLLGPPRDVEGECNAHLYLVDDYDHNYCTIRCRLKPGHVGLHCESFSRSNGGHVSITWEKNERKNGR